MDEEMRCIIDGYNLIYALGLLPSGVKRRNYAPGKLQHAREAVEQLLLKGLKEELLRETCLVYDALEPPRWLPDGYVVKGMRVVFASDYASADEWILETLQKSPRNAIVTIVSSDHRIQAYAKRRKWPCYDSDQWYYGGMPIVGALQEKKTASEENWPPNEELSPEDVAYWLEIFQESEERLLEDIFSDSPKKRFSKKSFPKY